MCWFRRGHGVGTWARRLGYALDLALGMGLDILHLYQK